LDACARCRRTTKHGSTGEGVLYAVDAQAAGSQSPERLCCNVHRYTVDGDSVFLAKQKLKAAAYGYKNDWDTLFAAIDHDGSGSLDQVNPSLLFGTHLAPDP